MKTLYTAIFALIIGSALGQTGTIKGFVKTSDGQGAPYVNIILKGEHKGVVSESDGSFIIKNIKEGNYIIVASFVGLTPKEKAIAVIADQITLLDFELEESAQQLSEVEVVGSRGLNEQTINVGKVAINPMDLPQAAMVIDRAILDKQQALTVGDVLMNTNGVYVMGTSGGTQQELAGRGFSFGSNNTFKNGVRFNNSVMPELSSVERVEILKGSSAILFGQVGAGGVLNIVTKKPKFENGGEFSFRAGSYGLIKPSLDFYGAINHSDQVAYRINASYENARSFRDNVKSDRIYFNPSFIVKAGKKTEILVQGDYLKDNRTLDFGTAAINYAIADLPRNRYLNTSWAYYKAEQKSASVTVKHQLNDVWQLHVLGSYQGFEQDQYGTTRPNASGYFVKTDGTWVRGLQRSGTNQDYYIAQVDVTGKIKTGSVEHTLLVGADIDKYATNTLAYTYKNAAADGKNIYDTINVYDLNIDRQRKDIPDIALNTVTKNPVNRFGIYVQDMINISEKFKALAGIRYSYVDNRSTVFTLKPAGLEAAAPTLNFPDAFSPRIGVVYQPYKTTSVFASYSNSFELNSGTDNKRQALPPSLIDQYEVGIKNEFFKGLLSANVTAYQIVNSNFAQTILNTSPNFNPDIPAAKELAGEITSKGFEIDLMSKSFQGVSIIGGYSYNDTRYTESNVYIKNSRLRYNPQHTANLSVFYAFTQFDFLKGLNVGFTSQYVGDRVAGRSTRTNVENDTYKLIAIPNYFMFDASVGYSRNNISLRVKVSNLLNELSYNVHDDNSVNPIAPRLFSATLSYKL
jgi:iron complex outermembrane recepter protein